MTLQRTQISLSDADRGILDAAARRTGLSMSALIRDAIQVAYGSTDDRETVLGLIDLSFGVVAVERPGEELVDQLRSGGRLAELA